MCFMGNYNMLSGLYGPSVLSVCLHRHNWSCRYVKIPEIRKSQDFIATVEFRELSVSAPA